VRDYISLNYGELAIASVLVLIAAALSLIFRLGIHRSLLVASVPITVQLALVGMVLTALFAIISPLWTGLAALGMISSPVTKSCSGRSGAFWVGSPTAWAPPAR
jgi:ABC-type iron transport system FetAB permease component